MHKPIFAGAIFCAIDALILLWVFDSVGGFLLGGFGFLIGIICASLIARFAD